MTADDIDYFVPLIVLENIDRNFKLFLPRKVMLEVFVSELGAYGVLLGSYDVVAFSLLVTLNFWLRGIILSLLPWRI